MPAMKAVKIIALVLVGFFLSAPHVALAQEPDQKAIGQDHPDVASTPSRNYPLEQALKINAEIVKLFNAGRYADAIPLAQRELAIYEKALGPNHPDVLTSLNTLAFFYEKQGRYADAEPLYQRAAAIREKEFGPDDPVVGSLLNTLAAIYNNQKRYAEAEPLQKRALAISEKAYGPNDPSVAFPLNSLATTYFSQGRYADAEPLYKRALVQIQPHVYFPIPRLAGQQPEYLKNQRGGNCEPTRTSLRSENRRARQKTTPATEAAAAPQIDSLIAEMGAP